MGDGASSAPKGIPYPGHTGELVRSQMNFGSFSSKNLNPFSQNSRDVLQEPLH